MKLHALGRPRLTDDTAELALEPLPLALLTYLATGGPRQRDHLAALFWHNTNNARNSLSTTLNRIRSQAPGAIWTVGQTQVGSDLPTDIAELRTALDIGDARRIVALYDAPFLSGLKLRRLGFEFEEWILEQRTALATGVELALLRQSRGHEAEGDLAAASELAELAWSIAVTDGFASPDNLQFYHRVLASAGSATTGAIRATAAEFGVDLEPVPPVELQRPTAVAKMQPATDAVGRRPDGSAGSRPPLFGLEDEQRQLVASLESNRITTVVGLGGSGKTRLAEHVYAAEVAAGRYDRCHWVSMRVVEDAGLVGPTLASALDLPLADGRPSTESIDPDERLLVVLDNFETVIEAAEVVVDLVAAHGGITALVTSRDPLGVPGEALVPLTGLALEGKPGEPSPAEELFTAAALRAGASVERVSGADPKAIHAVCARVGGHPLALELAGSWVGLLTPHEVLESLDLRHDLLHDSAIADGRSVTAVLAQSWAALDGPERRLLLLLSLFPAGCLTAELMRMPSFAMGPLRSLMQRSMISANDRGRLIVHPLVRDVASAELTAASDEVLLELRRDQTRWCSDFLKRATGDATRAEASGAPDALARELPNVVEIWCWAAAQGEWGLVVEALAHLREFHAESGRVTEGAHAFRRARESITPGTAVPPQLLPELLEASAWFEILLGRAEAATQLLAEGLAASSPELGLTHARLLRTLGVQQLQAGETDQAAATFQSGLDTLGDDGESNLVGRLRHDLGQAALFRGDIDTARSSFRAALDIGRATGDPAMVVRAYLTLGNLETDHDPSRAVVLLQEGRAVATSHSLDHLGAYFPYVQGLAHLALDELDLAETCFSAGIEASAEVRHPAQVCANHLGRAKTRLTGTPSVGKAVSDIEAATRLALQTQTWPYMMWAAIEGARACAAAGGDKSLARDLLVLAVHHDATHGQTRLEAEEALQESLGLRVSECAVPEQLNPRLDEVAERILEVLNASRSVT